MDDEETLREKIQAKQQAIDELNKKLSEEEAAKNGGNDGDEDDDDDSDDSDGTTGEHFLSRFFSRSPTASGSPSASASVTSTLKNRPT